MVQLQGFGINDYICSIAMFKIKIIKTLNKIISKHQRLNKFIHSLIGPQIVCNINYQFKDQKKVLICYLPQCFEPLSKHMSHPNILHSISIINALIKKGLCVDVCYSNDENACRILKRIQYDYILGFGSAFDKLTAYNTKAKHILLVTENDPTVVAHKYQERIAYFKERHPSWSLKHFVSRSNFYRNETFYIPENAIIMNSDYNIKSIKHPFIQTYKINVNGLNNEKFDIKKKLSSEFDAKRFLWFGSLGLLHKGLDILIDAFSIASDLTLDVYGVNTNELKAIKEIPSNVNICGRVAVLGEDFLKVAYEHTFVISASCSEGMNSGIATCMLHGIIPIVTPETGFDSFESILELESYNVEYIAEKLYRISNLSDQKLKEMSFNIFDFAHKNYTLDHFDKSINSIVQQIFI